MEPTVRVTARVLPVSPGGEVLLLQERDPARPDRHYWSSAGGAAEPGETLPEAAARELFEETGIVAQPAQLVGPVYVRDQAYSWGGVDYLGEHTYFALPLAPDATVSFDHLEAEEIGNVLGSGWWTAARLTGTTHEPPYLPEIVDAAVAAVAVTARGDAT